MRRCIGSPKPHRTVFRFFERYYDAKGVIHKRTCWNWENISKSGPKFRPKLNKNEYLMKRCIGFAKPHRTVLRFFERYSDAKEVIHKKLNLQWKGASDPHLCWKWENTSKSGPKVRPKIVKNWIFNEKVHRIRKPSQNRFSLFLKILRC